MIYNPKEVGQNILNQVKNEIEDLGIENSPTLVIVRVGDNIGSISYEKSIKNLLEPLKIKIKSVVFEEDINQDDFIQEIQALNLDSDIHSILILRPLPENFDLSLISSTIAPEKDVDASNPLNLGKLMVNDQSGFIPCTAEAVIELLDYYNQEVKGKDIVIINNSDIIGKPLSILLTNRFATTILCHEFTENLGEKIKTADIVISAVGKYGLISPEILNNDLTLIDLAITQEKDSDGNLILENNKPIRCGDSLENCKDTVANIISATPGCGDSLENCKDTVANIISATPGCGGGTGPITTALLAKNILKSYKLAKGD